LSTECISWHTGHCTFLAVEFFSPRGRPRPRGALPPPRPPRAACPPPRVPPPPRPNANTGAGAFGRPALLRNAGGAASDETAAARVVQSCTPDRGAAAPAACRAAWAASAAAIVPGTLLSLALFATRPLSDSSAAGPGRDISKGSSQPPRRGGAPAATAPRSSARRVQTASSRSRSPAAPDRRPRPAPNEPRRAHGARRRGLGCRAWLRRTRPTRRSEAAPVAWGGEPAG